MRFFGFWTILVALTISAVAAYYSIVGLVAIFAAAAIPVIIMGSALEVGKLTTAVWLHLNWKNAGFLIKTYLITATLLLMFITSMGIFGFLSRAHIEQTAVATEGQAQLVRIESEISRNETIIGRAEQKIQKLETADTTADDEVQRKIQVEVARIDATTVRIENTVTDLQNNLNASIAPWQSEFDTAVEQLSKLDELLAINTRDRDAVRRLQAFIKARPDGAWGTRTAARVEEFKQQLEATKSNSLAQMQGLRNSTMTEVQRVRGIGEQEIAQANTVIARLQNQLGTTRNDNSDVEVAQQLTVINQANETIDKLIETKYDIEVESRKLEAEVGPVKYIAELIYGDNTDKNTLEAAVRWVILIIVVVFDPLAVVLVISGISLVEKNTKRGKSNEENKQEKTSIEDGKATQKNVGSMGQKEERKSSKVETENNSIIIEEEQSGQIVLNTDEQEVIVFQGVEYAPGHHNYQRLREQLELNNRLRNELGIIKDPAQDKTQK